MKESEKVKKLFFPSSFEPTTVRSVALRNATTLTDPRKCYHSDSDFHGGGTLDYEPHYEDPSGGRDSSDKKVVKYHYDAPGGWGHIYGGGQLYGKTRYR